MRLPAIALALLRYSVTIMQHLYRNRPRWAVWLLGGLLLALPAGGYWAYQWANAPKLTGTYYALNQAEWKEAFTKGRALAPKEREIDPADVPWEEGNPAQRASYWQNLMQDPATGRIPEGIRTKELAFAEKQSKRLGQKSNGLDLKARGPRQVGGRTRALGVDIANPDIILAGGVSGGMWRTENRGTTWARVTGPDQSGSVSTLIQDQRPGHTNEWYYAGGEIRGNSAGQAGAPFRGAGIFYSDDNGESWTLVEETAAAPNEFTSIFQYVHELAIDTTNQEEQELYAAAYWNGGISGILRSTDGFQTATLVLDAQGETWSDVAVGVDGTVWATVEGNKNGAAGVYRSDDGINWVNITPPSWPTETERTRIGIAPSNPDSAYVLTSVGGLFAYDHSTGTWTNRSSSVPSIYNSQGSYNMFCEVHPENSQIVYIAGTDIHVSLDGFATPGNVTTFGGYTSGTNQTSTGFFQHPDNHVLVFDPTDPDAIFTGSDGGVHRMPNAPQPVEASWQSLNNNYLTTQFYDISLSSYAQTDLMFGGMQDNSTFLTFENDGSDWIDILGGDGGFSFMTDNSLVLSSQNGDFFRYDVDGLSISDADPIRPPGGGFSGQGFMFINQITFDPIKTKHVYVPASGVIYYTRDVTTDPNGTDWSALPANGFINTVTVSVQPAHRVYFGSTSGQLFRVDHADVSFTAADVQEITGASFPSGNINKIAVDPRDADKVLVCFSNYNIPSLYYTEDGGTTWTDVSGTLEENPDGSGAGPSVGWVSMLPDGEDETLFLAATSTGVYSATSLEGGSTVWSLESANLVGNTVVHAMNVRPFDGQVMIGTHGQGAYSARYPVSAPVHWLAFDGDYVWDDANPMTLQGMITDQAPGLAYRWYRNGEELDGEGTSTLTVPGPGRYELEVISDLNSGVGTRSLPVSIYGLELTNSNPVGVVCPDGDPVELSIAVEPAEEDYNYQWFLGSEPIAGAQSSTLNVTETGSYRVQVSTESGQVLSSESITTSLVSPIDNQLSRLSDFAYRVNGCADCSYEWTDKDGNVLGTTAQQNISPFYFGEVNVLIDNTCTQESASFTVYSITLDQQGENVFCPGESLPNIVANIQPAVDLATDPVTVNWVRNNIGIANSNQLELPISETGNYRIELRNSEDQLSFFSESAVISQREALPTQTITQVGSTTYSVTGCATCSYEWTDEADNVLSTSQTVEVAANFGGDVSVTVTDECESANENITVAITSLEDDLSEEGFRIYPSPTSGPLTVALGQALQGQVGKLTVYNLQGQQVLRRSFTGSAGASLSVDAGQLAAGTYVLEVTAGNQRFRQRFVRQ